MYVYMYLCMYVLMWVCKHVCMYTCYTIPISVASMMAKATTVVMKIFVIITLDHTAHPGLKAKTGWPEDSRRFYF